MLFAKIPPFLAAPRTLITACCCFSFLFQLAHYLWHYHQKWTCFRKTTAILPPIYQLFTCCTSQYLRRFYTTYLLLFFSNSIPFPNNNTSKLGQLTAVFLLIFQNVTTQILFILKGTQHSCSCSGGSTHSYKIWCSHCSFLRQLKIRTVLIHFCTNSYTVLSPVLSHAGEHTGDSVVTNKHTNTHTD